MFDVFTIASIGAGAIIMLLAVLKTSKVQRLILGVNVTRWRWLTRFMVIFLIGYIVSIALIVLGYNEPLLLIIGLVFLLGACFVYLVVFSAKSDMMKINDSSILLGQKNEELKKINQELDQFAYRTSHDLKAPVTSLQGLIDLASLSDSPEEVLMIHGMMKERLTSLECLIQDILDLSKNSRTEVQLAPVQVRPIIEQIVRDQGHGDNRSIHISITGDEQLDATIDPTRLKMVLGNLISNARDYADLSKPSPFIKIEYWERNGLLTFSIKDNGKGIAQEHQGKIFDMFFRAEESSKGSGLGLYIVKETTLKMGGTIRVISDLALGSEFIVSFPAATG